MSIVPKYFYKTDDFRWTGLLEKNWLVVRDELMAVIDEPAEPIPNKNWSGIYPGYVKNEIYPTAWKTFDFLFFGIKHVFNSSRCPRTSELLKTIPGLVSAQYSVMEAGTHILPHKGFTRMVLRCHLGLVIPEVTQCGIRVGDTIKNWEEGRIIIFDDSFEHEAWNKSKKKRGVLMFDIANPSMNYSAEQICRYKIENLNDSFLLNLADKKTWINWYEQGYFPE